MRIGYNVLMLGSTCSYGGGLYISTLWLLPMETPASSEVVVVVAAVVGRVLTASGTSLVSNCSVWVMSVLGSGVVGKVIEAAPTLSTVLVTSPVPETLASSILDIVTSVVVELSISAPIVVVPVFDTVGKFPVVPALLDSAVVPSLVTGIMVLVVVTVSLTAVGVGVVETEIGIPVTVLGTSVLPPYSRVVAVNDSALVLLSGSEPEAVIVTDWLVLLYVRGVVVVVGAGVVVVVVVGAGVVVVVVVAAAVVGDGVVVVVVVGTGVVVVVVVGAGVVVVVVVGTGLVVVVVVGAGVVVVVVVGAGVVVVVVVGAGVVVVVVVGAGVVVVVVVGDGVVFVVVVGAGVVVVTVVVSAA